jgi:hypothetical protein
MIAGGTIGIVEAIRVASLKYGDQAAQDQLEVANLQGLNGDAEGIALGRKILKGILDIDWKSVPDYIAKYNENNPEAIEVNDAYNGSDMETIAQLAAILAHENQHIIDLEEDGTTEEADAYKKELETYLNIINALDMDGDISFIAGMIAKLGDPESFKANEGNEHYAEISITKDTIGIRSSTFSERLMNPDFVGSTLRGLASLLGLNPYTDEKQPESDLDPRANERAHQIESDQIAALLFFAGAALSAEQIAANGGGSLLSYLSSLFNLNPQNIESLGDLAGTASNYSDIFNSITEYLSQGDIQINGAEGYDEFIRQVLKAEGFRDVEGYNISQDNDILNIMEQAGVPSEVANVFGGDKDLENQAANEVFNNFIFVSSLYQIGVTDPQTVSDLYLLGVPFSRTTDEGLVLWNNSPGFAEANKGLTSTYFKNNDYIDYQEKLDKMRTFNFMRSQYNSGNISLDTDFMLKKADDYKVMMDNGENFEFNDYFWNQYNMYTYNLFN